MVGDYDIKRLLFLDIETVSITESVSYLPEKLQLHWKKKSKFMRNQYADDISEEDFMQQSFQDKAAIFAEFGKIICISAGVMTLTDEGKTQIRVKSYAGDDEKVLLEEFADLLNKHFPDPTKHGICGHNIREFDVPYICRRMVVNQIELPNIINISGKKPWETKHLVDTLELWKFGDIKHYTSLDLLTSILDIPSPKDDIDGSMVGQVYWKEKNLDRITTYCEKDVVTVANLMLRYTYQPLISEDNVIIT